MRRLILILNALGVLIGGGLGIYLVYTQDPSQATPYVVGGFLGCLIMTLWGGLAYLLYGIRFSLARRHDMTLFIRSERQALLIALLAGAHLALQGFLLWNVFNATILTLVIVIIEYYYLSQESPQIIK